MRCVAANAPSVHGVALNDRVCAMRGRGRYNSSASGNGFQAADSTQNSGAYIFRPNSSTPIPVMTGEVVNTFTKSDTVQEVSQVWVDKWLKQTVRLYKNSRHVEVEFTVGPVPFKDGFVRPPPLLRFLCLPASLRVRALGRCSALAASG